MITIHPKIIPAGNVPYLQFNGKVTYRGSYRAIVVSPNHVIRPVQSISSFGSVSKRCTHQQAYPGDFVLVVQSDRPSIVKVVSISAFKEASYEDVPDATTAAMRLWLSSHPELETWLLEAGTLRRDTASYLLANANWVGAEHHLSSLKERKSENVAMFFRGCPPDFVSRVTAAAKLSRLCHSQWNWENACEDIPCTLGNDVHLVTDHQGDLSMQWDEWIAYDNDWLASHLTPLPTSVTEDGRHLKMTDGGTCLDFEPAHLIKVTFGSGRYKGGCQGVTWQLFGST